MRRIHLTFMCRRIHALHSFIVRASHSSMLHSITIHASHSSIVHVSDGLHACILSLFSCISNSAWSFADHSFFLACIKTGTQPHVQEITIYASHSFIVHLSHSSIVHISVTRYCALASLLFLYPCITYTASCSLACFLSFSCIKSNIQRLTEEIRADWYKAPNSHIVFRSLV